MKTLQEIRSEYPQYKDLSDHDLADGLYSKYYSDMPREAFDKQVGLDNDMSWADVAKQAPGNIASSGGRFLKDLTHPIMHPMQTVEDLGRAGLGAVEKTGITPHQESVPYADAIGKFFKDRYGSIDNLKKTIATDPIGFISDISSVLSGGESAMARAPGIVGRAGEALGKASRATDPLSYLSLTGKGVAKVGEHVIGDLGTHTGIEPMKYAAKAGYLGGQPNEAFLSNLRGQAPTADTVDEARMAVKKLRDQRKAAYLSGTGSVLQDPTILDFNKIDYALSSASDIKTYSGRGGMGPTQDLSPSTSKIRKRMADAVENWRTLDPNEFHTVEGFDALKQQLGDIRDDTEYGTPERVAADRIYNSVRRSITDQAPEYAKVMKGYEEASDQIRELERVLSLHPDKDIDPALRKLQSTLRDNVSTAYGRRKELAEFLVNAGAPNLMYKLSGQALQPTFARSMGRIGASLAAEMAVMGAGFAHSGPTGLAMGAATLPFMSPRLMGEVANKAGMASRPFKVIPPRTAARSVFQAGRMDSPLDDMTEQGLGQGTGNE
jgi:hypothetical protein